MSVKHPVIAITGSSGAGTTTSVTRTFQHIFRREKLNAAIIEGDAFHRYDRAAMKAAMAEAAQSGNNHFSHFGPEANLFEELEALFRELRRERRRPQPQVPAQRGRGRAVRAGAGHLHALGGTAGRAPTCCSTRACTVRWSPSKVNVARHADLLVGVVPIINLEWIQKLHRDKSTRGYSTEAVIDTILRRMPDYVNYIVPQFAQTHINFQRVPTVDTSNPFIARYIPSADESFLVIRFANPKGIDFPYLLTMLHDSFMSRPNIIVVPGGKMELAMQLIFTPMILQLMDRKRRA